MDRYVWVGKSSAQWELCNKAFWCITQAWFGWRKAAGVEPTRERLTPPTGFEARPRHRARLPSFQARDAVATLVEDRGLIVASNCMTVGTFVDIAPRYMPFNPLSI